MNSLPSKSSTRISYSLQTNTLLHWLSLDKLIDQFRTVFQSSLFLKKFFLCICRIKWFTWYGEFHSNIQIYNDCDNCTCSFFSDLSKYCFASDFWFENWTRRSQTNLKIFIWQNDILSHRHHAFWFASVSMNSNVIHVLRSADGNNDRTSKIFSIIKSAKINQTQRY